MTTHANTPCARERTRKLEAVGRVPREVYDLLAASEAPVKAYDLLWRLQEKRARRAPPSTIYRALAVLTEHGLVHKVESRNAYVVCMLGDGAHEPVFLICETCGAAHETDGRSMIARANQLAARAGFEARNINFVVTGVCATCNAGKF